MKIFSYITWSALGSIGRSPVSKLSILMPFVGYIILFQDKVIAFATPLALQEGSNFRVGIGFYILYFGLFSFGLASFLFHVASPQTAKDFKSSDDYVERLQELVSASDLIAKLNVIIRSEVPGSSAHKEASLYKNTLTAGIGGVAQQYIKVFTLRNYFYIIDRSRKAFIFPVAFLFLIGVILIFIPSIIVLFRVFSDFYQSYVLNLLW